MKRIIKWLCKIFKIENIKYIEIDKNIYITKIIEKEVNVLESDVIIGDVLIKGDLTVQGFIKVEGDVTSFSKKSEIK